MKMRAYVLDHGRIELDKSVLVASVIRATVTDKNPPAIWTHSPIYTVLIKHPEGWVLFDASCNPNGMAGIWSEQQRKQSPYFASEEQSLPARLEQLRIRPEDIKYVVVSHLHVDHAGCLDLFTNAEIIAHDLEFAQAMKNYGLNRDGVYVRKDIEAWIRNGLHWNLITSGAERIKLLDGLTILNFGPGHTPGMLGLMMELPEKGNVILASDAAYTSENYGPPVRIPGIIFDSVGYVSTINRIRELEKEKSAEVWFGHDKNQFPTLIKSSDGYYE